MTIKPEEVAYLRDMLEEDHDHCVKVLKTATSTKLVNKMQVRLAACTAWLKRLNAAHPKE